MGKLTYLSVIEQDKRLFDLAELGQQLDEVGYDNLFTRLIDTVDDNHLDLLAEAYHILGVEGWDFAETTEQKRQLLKQSVQLHRLRGTPWSVKTLLQHYGLLDRVQLVEWWQNHPLSGRAQPPKTVDLVVRDTDARQVTKLLPALNINFPAGTVSKVVTYSKQALNNPLSIVGIGVMRQYSPQGVAKHIEVAPTRRIHNTLTIRCLSANRFLNQKTERPCFQLFSLLRTAQ